MRDGLEYNFWVYILSSRTGTLYTGITGFFTRRVLQHKYDSIERASPGNTKCDRLVCYERHQDVLPQPAQHRRGLGTPQVAIAREKQIKRWRREKKIALIEKTNPRRLDVAGNCGREVRLRGQSLGRTP
jgi:putative endonuclease